MIYQKFTPYRVPINVSILDSSAARVLEESKKPETLLDALGWGNEHLEFVRAGLAPVKDSRKLLQLMKENTQRRKLRADRIARGYATPVTPRPGLKGWIQRKFRDPKENRLPITLDVFAWLRGLPRYQLLVAIHDGLLGQVSSAEPRPVTHEYQMGEFVNPVAEMMRNNDQIRAELLRQSLGNALHALSPQAVVDDIAGYVVAYDRNHGVAYYYAA